MKIPQNTIAKGKPEAIRKLILDSLCILECVGVPLGDLTPRRLEKMAMSFLALCSMTIDKSWAESASVSEGHILRTRQIISYINSHFEEKISSGSYDDIRRKDLIRLTGMGLVVKSANNPEADTNDGTRGYGVESKFSSLIRTYGTKQWDEQLESFEIDEDYIAKFNSDRTLEKLTVTLEPGVQINLDPGPHNLIQKAIVEEFLPRFGYDAKVLYISDTSEKKMHNYTDSMVSLGLNIEDRGMLPDIVAFSERKQWLYLIEAVHSSNPLNAERCIELQRTVLKSCPHDVIFVTAFLTKTDFAKWSFQIAWETEVWLAETPDHMIHFNGDKFFGPHKPTDRA